MKALYRPCGHGLWPEDIAGARMVQECLRERVRVVPLRISPSFVAGVDAAFTDGIVIAVASLFRYPELEHVQDAYYRGKNRFPYVPGFLSFREGRAVLDAMRKLDVRPDLILVDGQGIAHPRGIGIASHLGVILEIPSIGCAKSRLIGHFVEPGQSKGDWTYLERGEKGQARVGAVLRTRTGVRPLFVSPGHLVDIPSAVGIVMGCVRDYRIPEPLRRADIFARRLREKE